MDFNNMDSSANFILKSEKTPAGDQPNAISQLTEWLLQDNKKQLLIGVTGSGKTFTIANVIRNIQIPVLIITHNKTLAAQWYQELKSMFPENSVQYYISFYDFYRPESYIPRTNTYIEKESVINAEINKLRLDAIKNVITRQDTIIVSSISCIFEAGNPNFYKQTIISLKIDMQISIIELIHMLEKASYEITDELNMSPGSFRTVSSTVDICTWQTSHELIKIKIIDDHITTICFKSKNSESIWNNIDKIIIFPASSHVFPDDVFYKGLESIKNELDEWATNLLILGKDEESKRIIERTNRDLMIMRETHRCNGIENYSIHFQNRKTGEPPNSLFDFFPSKFLLIIDESHQTIPQMKSMYLGSIERISRLIEFGFRLPSALDNRPLKFEEAYERFPQTIYVSATPSPWELNDVGEHIVEQIIRPTGLLDPIIEVRSSDNQLMDSIIEIKKAIASKQRVLVIALTKKMAEKISKFLLEKKIKSCYIHSEVKSYDRIDKLNNLRSGSIDVIVGINLLREGLDLPEVSRVIVLDADQEGFLRSSTALMQICGRAARNKNGLVIFYANKITKSMEYTINENNRRREIQILYNKVNNIIPTTTTREITKKNEIPGYVNEPTKKNEIKNQIQDLTEQMNIAAKEHRYKDAILLREKIKILKKINKKQ